MFNTTSKVIGELVDKIYEPYAEPSEHWTAEQHKAVTDAVKHDTRINLRDANLGVAVTNAVRKDAESRGQDVEWHLERIPISATALGIDLSVDDKSMRKAKFDMHDHERAGNVMVAFELLMQSDADPTAKFYASGVFAFYMSAGSRDDRHGRGSIKAATARAQAYAESSTGISDEQRACIPTGAYLGKELLFKAASLNKASDSPSDAAGIEALTDNQSAE